MKISKIFYWNIILLSILYFFCSNNGFCDEIEGVFIPQGKYDSKLPTVTMMLDKNRAPVVRITPSRPTILIFPRQVSSCFSDHAALKTEKASSVKINADQKEVNFYSVVLKVIGANLKDFEDIDQTTVVCQLIDSNYYTIAVTFTDINPYSVVKLIESPPEEINYAYDMSSFSPKRIGQKNSIEKKNKKIKKEFIENINDSKSMDKILNKGEESEKKDLDELMRKKFKPFKKDTMIVKNKDQDIKTLSNSFQSEIKLENSLKEKNELNNDLNNKNSVNSIAELLDKKGYKRIKGVDNGSK